MMTGLRNAKHLFAPLTANCRDFHETWAAAPPPDGSIAGRWEGEWRSLATGHHGPLSCVLRPLDSARWRACFRASYSGIFRACYATDLTVTQAADRWTFDGGSDLGWIAGGVYTYEGHATPSEFVSSYRSRYDHGRFVLSRPATR